MVRLQTRHAKRQPLSVSFLKLLVVPLVFHSLGSNPAIADTNEPQSKQVPIKETFAEPIASIVYTHCSNCHRPGQSGPFSLLNYSDVSQHADTIQVVIRDNFMPPWKPIHTGIDFTNDRRLSEQEKKQIDTWIVAGCLEGDPLKTPKAPEFPNGWSLGTPDLVVQMERPFQIPADGPDLYRSFVFPIGLPEDKWIKAIEVRPTARGVVHHALFFLDIDGAAREQKSADGQLGFAGMNFMKTRGNALERMPDSLARGLGGYVPGATPNRLPGDLARFLPKGSDIVMQTHFHPTGKKESEQSQLGLYFADHAPKQLLVPVQLPPLFGMGAGIDIDAGDANYLLHDEYVLPIDIVGFEIGGHAHYICRKMTMTATPPGGKPFELLRIDDWDLDWQDQYLFKSPVPLAKGTKLKVDIVYDNSAANPENPFSPPRPIGWGRESTDEMGSITMLAIAKNEAERVTLEQDIKARTTESLRNRIRSQLGGIGGIGGLLGRSGPFNGGLLKLLDRNRDGKLQRSELPEKQRDRLLDLMDTNNDDTIDQTELDNGRKSIEQFLNVLPKPPQPKPPQARGELKFSDLDGKSYSLNASLEHRALVLIFVSTDCPIANSYQPSLARLHKEFHGQGFEFLLIHEGPDQMPEKLKEHSKVYSVPFSVVMDNEHRIAEQVGATKTPEVFVFARDGAILYHGRIDDLHQGFGKKRAAVTREDLRLALGELNAGEDIRVPKTEAVGCSIPMK